jgi:hypothetical protein
MRALRYIIALVFILTGPSLAGSADRDMPGVGTFTYCGSPVVTIAPDLGRSQPVNQRRIVHRTMVSGTKTVVLDAG